MKFVELFLAGVWGMGMRNHQLSEAGMDQRGGETVGVHRGAGLGLGWIKCSPVHAHPTLRLPPPSRWSWLGLNRGSG